MSEMVLSEGSLKADGLYRRIVRVAIRGDVQRVGFRRWAEKNAAMLSVAGWIRNRSDGSVEATFVGSDDSVSEIISRCERGPSSARVEGVSIVGEGPRDGCRVGADGEFRVLPTV